MRTTIHNFLAEQLVRIPDSETRRTVAAILMRDLYR